MASVAACGQFSLIQITTNKRGGRSLCRPQKSRENDLLQVGHRGQVGRELDDASRAAPVRTCPQRIVPGNGGGSDLSIESTREDAAITLRQVGVGVAQVQREHLVGKANADVPGVVISIMDAIREHRGTVEAVCGSKPLPPELAGDIHANAAAAEDRARGDVFAGDRSIVAPGARVEETRRVELGHAELPIVIDGVGALSVDLEKADILLHGVAVEQGVGSAFRALKMPSEIKPGTAELAGATGIQVAPDADIEGKCAEGRADTAVDIDFSSGPVGEGNAFERGADVELQVLIDVVARLEIGGDRR